MADLKQFLKGNKKKKENTYYPATKSLCDADGNPLKWEIKALSTRESERIQDECTTEVPIPGKPGTYRAKFNTTMFVKKYAAASVVFPNLYDANLQDSYGVRTPEDLITEMIDSPEEFNKFAEFCQQYSGYDKQSLQNAVDAAKN